MTRKMNILSSLLCSILCITIFKLTLTSSLSNNPRESFLQCLSTSLTQELIYTPNEPSYLTALNISIQNQRFASPSYPKPIAIITPTKASHVQTTVLCSKRHRLRIRTRSGGHDFEGLSYVAVGNRTVPFVVIDLIRLRNVTVDVFRRTAWVQAGATVGEVCYEIAQRSDSLGFPAGLSHTVGVGGHFSGGGYGMMMRKHGLAADNIVDAQIVDVKGRVLDRRSMGEGLFWAIRGGGAASFGVVLSWKIRLVRVPLTVTVLNVVKILEQNNTMNLVNRWQYVANKFNENLTMPVRFLTFNSSANNRATLIVTFIGLFLGGVERLVPMVGASFPELNLTREDCTEMSWIESVLYFAGFPIGQPLTSLLDRKPQLPQIDLPYKGKSDYVREPIPKRALEIALRKMYEVKPSVTFYQFFPYGARMSEIRENDIPFPHRRGNLYLILYLVFWEREEDVAQRLNWIRSVYNYMTPYVSKNPRSAYFNYRDLDIGNGSSSYSQASIWGTKYFRNNFRRLVDVKTKVDPSDFFTNEQSIPPLSRF